MKKAGFVHNRVKYLNFNGQNEITFFVNKKGEISVKQRA